MSRTNDVAISFSGTPTATEEVSTLKLEVVARAAAARLFSGSVSFRTKRLLPVCEDQETFTHTSLPPLLYLCARFDADPTRLHQPPNRPQLRDILVVALW